MPNGFFGGLMGGKGQTPIEEQWFGFGNSQANEEGKHLGDTRKAWNEATGQHNKDLDTSDATLSQQMGQHTDEAKKNLYGSHNDFLIDQHKLEDSANGALQDSKQSYTNDINPRQKDLMEKGKANSDSAMTLSQAMDPNNSVAQATRQLYETQAQNEGRAGLADAGTLQALGAQNFAGAMGGRPMTGGQMSALMGQNMAQSGQAYANTQRRIQGLRDQGLDKGYERSDIAYNQGQDAQNTYGNRINNAQNAGIKSRQEQSGIRNEMSGYDQNEVNEENSYNQQNFGLGAGMSGLNHQLAGNKVGRQQAADDRYYGGQVEDLGGKINNINAKNAAKQKMLGGGLSTLFGAAGNSGGFGNLFGGGKGGGKGGSGGDKGTPVEGENGGDWGSTGGEGGEAVDTGGGNQDNQNVPTVDDGGSQYALTGGVGAQMNNRGYRRGGAQNVPRGTYQVGKSAKKRASR